MSSLTGSGEDPRTGNAKGLLFWTLLGPSAWFVHFNLAYVLVYRACTHDSRLALWVVSILCLAACGAAVFASHGAWVHIRGDEPRETGVQGVEGLRILSVLAFVSATGSALLIVGNAVPIGMLHGCD